jgi:hypothetical protein
MKKTILKVAVSLVGSLFILSCSSDGAQGPAGPAGTNGTNGINGNANVISTNPVTVNSTNWIGSNSNALWYTTFSASGITQQIVDKGIVSVFISDSSGAWSPIPYTFANTSYHYSFGVGFINIYTSSVNLTAISNPGIKSFRVVIIPSSVVSSNKNTNWNDYNEVVKILNLNN